MKRHVPRRLLAFAIAIAGCARSEPEAGGAHQPTRGPPGRTAAQEATEKESPAARAKGADVAIEGGSIDARIVGLIEPLQRGPWTGWRTGTRVTVQFVDASDDQIQSHVQPDLIYVVEERDQRLARFQEVQGKLTRQEFPIGGGGLPKGEAGEGGQPVELTIDGASVRCLRFDSFMEWIGENDGGQRTWRRWVLAQRPSILLREENDRDWWSITSLRRRRIVAGRAHQCVETTRRMGVSDGVVMITELLSSSVPGHVVERIQRFFRGHDLEAGRTPWLVAHERVTALRIP
jgi:hypothetical protein